MQNGTISMISYQLFESGFCTHCERMTLKTGKIKRREYPSLCVLIKHDQAGYILFDTGYNEDFFKLTQGFPFSLYAYLTPVNLQKSLKSQLINQGIHPSEINYIVISHFHSDHIAGLRDFPKAQFICHQEALNDIRYKNRYQALLKGFLPELLPNDFYQRTVILDKEVVLNKSLHPFMQGFDLFGDRQLIAIPLPGHAKGHIGLYLNSAKKIFFIADSCWHKETFMDLVYPSQLTYLIHDNKKKYLQTIRNLHELHTQNKTIELLPSHCQHARKQVGKQIIC